MDALRGGQNLPRGVKECSYVGGGFKCERIDDDSGGGVRASASAERSTNRVRRDGKFFRLGSEKFYVKGVTYGPFKPDAEGLTLPTPAQTRRDFEQMLELGANCVRIYHTPPVWFLDLAQEMGLKIFLDVAWAKNLTFIGDAELTRQAHEAVRSGGAGVRQSPGPFRAERGE